MDSLSNIFGSKTRIKIMRLFMLNPDRVYSIEDVIFASRGEKKEVEKELQEFKKAGLIKKKVYYREITSKRSGKKRMMRTRSSGFALDASFIYLNPLRALLVNTILLKGKELIRRLQKTAHLKVVVISGIFIQDWDSRVDLLVVGDKIRKSAVLRVISSIESEIGKELRFVILDSSDFIYRFSVGDRLIRDIFDFSHQVVLDRLGLKSE